jgi:quercetin dioxygenase-like cupin family protein
MSIDDTTHDKGFQGSDVWSKFVADHNSPGFSLRTTFPTNPEGVEVMLETWEAGTDEPPHSHPGDDMTVVVKGRMSTQVYRRDAGSLVAEGERVFLSQGDVGYHQAGNIHDAQYLEDCQLVYVHDGAFAFIPADAKA